jgi:hypothetical protein
VAADGADGIILSVAREPQTASTAIFRFDSDGMQIGEADFSYDGLRARTYALSVLPEVGFVLAGYGAPSSANHAIVAHYSAMDRADWVWESSQPGIARAVVMNERGTTFAAVEFEVDRHAQLGVVAIDSQGELLWETRVSNTTPEALNLYYLDITLDSNGTLLVTGELDECQAWIGRFAP